MSKSKAKTPQFIGFVQVTITTEQLNEFLEAVSTNHEIFAPIMAEVDRGLRLTVSFIPENETYKASFFDISPKSHSAGYILTAEAPTSLEALDLLYFKHFVIANRNWLPFLAEATPTKRYR